MPSQPRRLPDSVVNDSRRVLGLSLWSGILLLDAVVWARRLAGAMTLSLSPPIVWGSSLVLTAAAILALVCWRAARSRSLARRTWWPEFAALALPLLWSIAVGLRAAPFTWGGLAALWGIAMIGVGLVGGWFPQQEVVQPAGELAPEAAGLSEPPTTDNGQPTDDRSTHSQKRTLVDGVEVIEGEALVEFPAGQKEATLHLSFCPPFQVRPELHAEDALGEDLEIRAEAVHPFGARLSVRRATGLDHAESRHISYVAAPPSQGEAAA